MACSKIIAERIYIFLAAQDKGFDILTRNYF